VLPNWPFIIFSIILLPFAMVVIFSGAPYLPTRKKQILDAIKLANLKSGDYVVDLGSGDGAVQKVLAERGVHSLGYEINPYLFLISKLRLYKHRKIAKVKLSNFWEQNLPPETSTVFVFLLDKYMERLDVKLKDQSHKLNKPLNLISFAFKIPGKDPLKIKGGMLFYEYNNN
jgi:hypothetical protein